MKQQLHDLQNKHSIFIHLFMRSAGFFFYFTTSKFNDFPVLFCMQERGPESSAGCRAQDAWPIVDETGLVP